MNNSNLDDDLERIFAEAEGLTSSVQTKIELDREEWRQKEDMFLENPQEAHRLYFKLINRVLKDFLYPILPKSEARVRLLEQKNLLLNEGKKKNSNGIRGSSGQMSKNTTKKMVLEIIQEWVSSDSISSYNLYCMLRDKNIELGYISKNEKI